MLKFVRKNPINNTLALIGAMQVIIWTDVNPIHWRIYEALGGMS